MLRGIRGATTVDSNRAEEIVKRAYELLNEVVGENKIDPDRVASVFISMTKDLNAEFPAKALRQLDGWTFVPVMCMSEVDVKGAIPQCIRVMMHVNTEVSPKEIRHVYLHNAIGLRPDLLSKKGEKKK